tara:strand:+ start:262 stop:1173 length:912 start_codon:yes stop_codon:yes gene_type:complete
MDIIIAELKTTQKKKYNIKCLLKTYEKSIDDQIESGDINASASNNLHIMYLQTLKYYHQNKILRKENDKLKNKKINNFESENKIKENIKTMAKPNINSTVSQIKDYIRTNKLNHPRVKLTLTKPKLIAGLKLIDHWDDGVVKTAKKRVKKVPPPPAKPKMSKEDEVRPVDKKVSTPPPPPPVSKPSKGIKVGKPPPPAAKPPAAKPPAAPPAATEEIPKVSVSMRDGLNIAFMNKYGMKTIYQVLKPFNNNMGSIGRAKQLSREEIKRTAKQIRLKLHPDKGGDADEFAKVNEALQIMLKTLK